MAILLALYVNHKYNTIGKTKDEIEEYSFLLINNLFNDLSFGRRTKDIYDATPAKIWNAILLGLYNYICKWVELTFTDSAIDLIIHVVVGTYQSFHRQSNRNLSGLDQFRHGLISVKSLKPK